MEPPFLQSLAFELGKNFDFLSLRYVKQTEQVLYARCGYVQPAQTSVDEGVMVVVHHNKGCGYAATSDISTFGLKKAAEVAAQWAAFSSKVAITDFSVITMPKNVGEYHSKIEQPWYSVSIAEKINLLKLCSEKLKISDKIVDWRSSLWNLEEDILYATNQGALCQQYFKYVCPNLEASAHHGSETITRSYKGRGLCRQIGYEGIREGELIEQCVQTAEEALALLAAPNCPEQIMSVLLDPDQMILQIHESIGHPLELDRILGDERNYAGTSFVNLDMFGSYRYGSSLLNVTFDPSVPGEFASYAYDDEGQTAQKVFLIQDGILKHPLGGGVSSFRAGFKPLANARASSWNRPAIDRMANINIEPGVSSLAEMIASIENGIYMKTNASWSIDDSRNKFQFGCEWARLIKNGQLGELVKKPNYRGISANFWRNLVKVGDETTMEALGSPFCGKGEPNQAIKVGHRSPACVFSNVEVFGGV